MTFSVGDFAEQLIAEEKAKGNVVSPPSFEPDTSVYSPHVEEQAPDISKVEVPDDFITSIVENKVSAIPEPFIQTEEVEERVVQPISEVAELKSLITEVKDLLLEVKQTLSEMTTVGAGIGAPNSNVDKRNREKKILGNFLRKLKLVGKKLNDLV